MALGPYIFFDVDDTLVQWTTSWTDTFAQVAREAGVPATSQQALDALNLAFTTIYPESIKQHSPARDLHDFWVRYDGQVLALLGVEHDLDRHAERVVSLLQHPGSIRLYPEVPEVLEALVERGAQLGVVSGRPLAAPDLEALGVGHYFDPVIDAFAVGSAKSDGHMFRLAAEVAAQAGRVGWHVGDSYTEDVQRARAAGLRPVLVDRRGRRPEADCPRLPDLRSLPEVVAPAPSESAP